MSILALAVRTWLRYLLPLTGFAALALAGVALVAFSIAPPQDVAQARVAIRIGWILAGTAVVSQLLLVAAAAPLVASVARGRPLSSLPALIAGAHHLGRGLVPWAVALAAIVTGTVALAVPGVLLLGLFALTGASERLGEPLPLPLADSVAVVRRHARTVAIALAIVVAADLAVALVAHLAIAPALGNGKPALALLAPARTFVRIVALALIAISAGPACVLAAIYQRASAADVSTASRA